MRISDWSSDVCSSDLLAPPVRVLVGRPWDVGLVQQAEQILELHHQKAARAAREETVCGCGERPVFVFGKLTRLRKIARQEPFLGQCRDQQPQIPRTSGPGLGQRLRGRPKIELLPRSEERRVGKGWVSTCRSRGAPYPEKKKKTK